MDSNRLDAAIDSSELERAPCPNGCGGPDVPLFRASDLLTPIGGEFTIVRCRSCALLRTDPRPTVAGMNRYHSAPEGFRPGRGAVLDAADGVPAWKRKVWDWLVEEEQQLPLLAPGRLRELGWGNDEFLRRMVASGWSVDGFVPFPPTEPPQPSSGLRLQYGPLEAAAPPECPLDLAVMWGVLEHLHDPAGALRTLRSWTRPGGWLVFSVPDVNCFHFRWFRELWAGVQVPTHLYHFAPDTAKRLLETTGWELARTRHLRHLNYLCRSTGNWLEAHGRLPWLAQSLQSYLKHLGRNYLLGLPIATVLAAFGQTGIMSIWARRSPD